MTMAGIQAPDVNLETSTTTRMIDVAVAPTALIAMPDLQPRSLRRRWWRTIPAWDRVKAVNSPTAKSGTSAATAPPKAQSRRAAAAARAMMPWEKTSRSPRWASWRGMKPSRATIEERRGKSAKEVLADRHRMAAVEAWSTMQSGPSRPKTWSPKIDRIVSWFDSVG